MTISNDPSLIVHAYVDGELDVVQSLEIERQIAGDPTLAAERARVEALRSAIRERLPREAAPPNLVRRIEAAIASQHTRGRSHVSSRPSWRALAASVVLTAFLASGSTWLLLNPGPTETVADIVVANHLRALMATKPIDIASSDSHTVKPWFNGRIPDAPRVVDLDQKGFPLVGGRIDVIGRVPVATLVYQRRQHLISLSAVPSGALSSMAPVPRAIAGYNILSWTDGDIIYWAVSDVAAGDLSTFVEDFRSAT
jgi:anti-sigma factor RsiW